MTFSHFSGVFGIFDGTEAVETGSAGYADRNFLIKNDPSFSYQTASGTKGFTAAAILALIAAGKLSLDDCAKNILGRHTCRDQYGDLKWLSERVTVRTLLSHTSGVPDYFDESCTDDFEQALNGNANYHFEKPVDFFPLADQVWESQTGPYLTEGLFKYSNGGFVILAAVAEAVTGESFPELIARHVLQPAGMNRSGLFRLDAQAPAGITRAASYQNNGRSNIYAVPVIGGGDGGAYTNPQDMARFWNMLDPDRCRGSAMSDLIDTAWKPLNDADDNCYGLGFWISKKNPRIVFLEGFDPGVQFFSFYNRNTKHSLTICLNDENMNCDEVFEQYFSFVES